MKSFTVTSDTEAYIEARKRAANGEIVETGRAHLPFGVVAATFEPANAPRRNPQLEVKLDPREFVKVLRDYKDWQVKWWREAVQNSVDAGATKIYLDAHPTEDNLGMVVSCTDNGRGMSLDTFANKFLVLGGSGKEQSTTTIGGFGEAKKLLILPWLEWHVRSTDFSAHGKLEDGTSLRPIYEDAPPIVGTELRVVMAANYGAHGAATSHVQAMEFLQLCHLPHVQFFVNGELFNDWLVPGEHISDEKYGTIERDPNKDRNYMVVRAGGLFMFHTQWVSEGLGTIVYELTARTVDVLTSNRDGFRVDDASRPLYYLSEKLATEHKRAFKQKQGFFVKAWKGALQAAGDDRFYEGEQNTAEMLDAAGPTPPVDEPVTVGSGAMAGMLGVLNRLNNALAGVPSTVGMASADVAQFMFDAPIVGQESTEALAQQLVWQPAFLMVNEIAGFVPDEDFFPETMAPKVKALMQLWAECCRWVFIQKGSKARWGVGFIFSEDAEAAYYVVERNSPQGQDDPASVGEWLLLNPFVFKRSKTTGEIYSRSERKHLQTMYALAIHECTHMADGVDSHDSAFASAVTDNFAFCADGFQNVVKIAKSIRLEKRVKPPKEAKPKREKKIRDKGGLILPVAVLRRSYSDVQLVLQDENDRVHIVEQLLLRLQTMYTEDEIADLKAARVMAPISRGDVLYFTTETADALLAHIDRATQEDSSVLSRIYDGEPTSFGLSVDDLADLYGLTVGLSPASIVVRARATGDWELIIERPAAEGLDLGTTAFFRRLSTRGLFSLDYGLDSAGFLPARTLEQQPYLALMLAGLGLDPLQRMADQLGGISTKGVTGAVGALEFLMCANAFGAGIEQYGIETVLPMTDRV